MAVTLIYSLYGGVGVGAGETRLINTSSGNFIGSFKIAADSLDDGQAIRIHAWGRFTNTTGGAVSNRMRLYFNGGTPPNAYADLTSPVLDTGAGISSLPTGSTNAVWHLFAQLS